MISYTLNFNNLYLSDAVYALSKFGKPRLYISGYIFGKKRIVGMKTHWTCIKGRGCRAIVHTLEDRTICKYNNVHNHPKTSKQNVNIFLQ